MKTLRLLSCLIFAAAGMAAADQELAIAAGIHNDALAQAAINDLNGDILAIWTRFSEDFAMAAVLGRFAWRQQDGSYVLGDELQISPSGEFHAFPHVDFVPWDDSYAVVWQTFDPGSGLLNGGKIMGRKISAAGAPRGAARTIVRSKRANVQPTVIATTPWIGAPPPYDQDALTLLYTALPIQPGQSKLGVVAQPLRPNLKRQGRGTALGGIQLLGGSAPYTFDDLDVQPVVTDAVHFHPFLSVGMTTFDLQGGSDFASLLRLGRNAAGRLTVLDRTDFEAGSHGPDFADVTIADDPDQQDDFGASRSSAFVLGTFVPEFVDDHYSGDLDGYLLVGSLADVDGAYLPRNYDNDIPTMNADLPIRTRSANLADSPIGRLIYPERKRMVSRRIRRTAAGTLEIDAKRRKLFKLDQRTLLQSESLASDRHPARAVLWVEEAGASRQAIHLYIE